MFFTLPASSFPIELHFWRVSRATLVWHRCPLWDSALGLNQKDCIAIDLLHSYYLGPLQVWAKLSWWCLIDAGLWGAGTTTAEERQAISIAALNHELQQWYSRYDAAHPGSPISRINKLNASRLGAGRGPRRFKTKAMECWGCALFLLYFLERKADRLPPLASRLLEGGRKLVSFMEDLKGMGPNISDAEAQHLLDTWKQWMVFAEEVEAVTPKSHLMYHLILKAPFMGNPLRYQVFADESLNRVLRDALRLCHQSRFEVMGILKMQEILRRPYIRRRLA